MDDVLAFPKMRFKRLAVGLHFWEECAFYQHKFKCLLPGALGNGLYLPKVGFVGAVAQYLEKEPHKFSGAFNEPDPILIRDYLVAIFDLVLDDAGLDFGFNDFESIHCLFVSSKAQMEKVRVA